MRTRTARVLVWIIAAWFEAAGCAGADGDGATNTGGSNAGDEGAPGSDKADYIGQDDREDPYAEGVTDRQRRWARATSAMVTSDDLTSRPNGDGAPLHRADPRRPYEDSRSGSTSPAESTTHRPLRGPESSLCIASGAPPGSFRPAASPVPAGRTPE